MMMFVVAALHDGAASREQRAGDGALKAVEFAYECPHTLSEALAILSEPDIETRPIAGGQSLMPMMNFRLAQPDRLLDLNRLTELSFIRENGDMIEIGAMTRLVQLEKSAQIAEHLPVITAALPHIAHPAIRNRGTIGGSVALADPAAELPALLLALDARIYAVSQSDERVIDAGAFFLGPYETALAPTEILQMIAIPKPGASRKFAFQEVARRHGDYAMAGVAVLCDVGQYYADPIVAFFGVSDRVVRAPSVEAALDGQAVNDQQAIDAAVERVGDIAFNGDLHTGPEAKRHLAGVILRRALAELVR